MSLLPAAVLLIAGGGIAQAYFTASGTGKGQASTASVTLANSAVTSCPVTGLLPDATPHSCAFTATYSGSAAYLAVDVLVETQAGPGGTALYTPGAPASSLQITLASTTPSVSYSTPVTATDCPVSAPSGSTCYELDNELIGTGSFTTASIAFSIGFQLPVTSATGYQGGAAQIILTTHAVQSAGNTLSCTAAPAAGSPCAASGSFRWR